MTKMLIAIVIAIGIVAAAGQAHAQAPGETAPREQPPQTRRYGWKIAATDLAAVTLIVVGGVGSSSDAGWGPIAVGAGVLTYVAGGAVVHGRHGRSGAAAKSVALRVLLPVGAGGLLALAGSTQHNREYPVAMVLGGVVGVGLGAVTAMGIDWFGLARERRVMPVVQPVRGGGAIAGLAGTF